MSEFGDRRGISGLQGYNYQALLALYYLIVKEAREIEWEADGEDITIINEESDRKSIEYIQAKKLESGSFSLSEFKKSVLPQFWKAYCSCRERVPDKYIKCTLITTVAWDSDLKILIEACKLLRERGLTLKDFERLLGRIKTKYDSIRRGKNPGELRRFLFGLNVIQPFTSNQIEEEILSYLKDCGIIEPRSKIRQMLQEILRSGQGSITRRKIEDIAGKSLTPIPTTKSQTTYTYRDIAKAVSILKRAKIRFGATNKMPDKEKIIRKIISPAESVSQVLTGILSDNTTTISTDERQEFREIISVDIQKVREEAYAIAESEERLWLSKKRYAQKIESLETIAHYIKEDDLVKE